MIFLNLIFIVYTIIDVPVFPRAHLHLTPVNPLFSQAIITLLSVSMGHAYMFFS